MDFNFIASTYDSLDLDTLRQMSDELIDLYGYPCIYRKYMGPDMLNHPLYKDRLTSTNNIDKYYYLLIALEFCYLRHFKERREGQAWFGWKLP
jgi:hypothetical protein